MNFKNIKEVESWLEENRTKFISISQTNVCRKWSKWVSRNETPFPCVCSTRNEDCILAEVYYKLSKTTEIMSYEYACEEAMMDLHTIKDDYDDQIKKWVENNQALLSDLEKFTEVIYITKSQEPYEKMTIRIKYPEVFADFKVIFTTDEV